MKKTNAQRHLELHHVEYGAEVYDEAGAFHTAEEAARLLGVQPSSVYKTLVVLRESAQPKPLLVMIAADCELDLRRLAREVREKKLRMATRSEAERLTGLQVGGISALAVIDRGFKVYIDRRALDLDCVHVSGGARGLDLKLRTSDLIRLTGADAVEVGSGVAFDTREPQC